MKTIMRNLSIMVIAIVATFALTSSNRFSNIQYYHPQFLNSYYFGGTYHCVTEDGRVVPDKYMTAYDVDDNGNFLFVCYPIPYGMYYSCLIGACVYESDENYCHCEVARPNLDIFVLCEHSENL